MRGFISGIVVGYGVGRLLAREPGSALRERIVRAVREQLSRLPAGEGGKSPKTLAYALNQATQEELMSVHGIGPGLARRIIRHRPYRTGAEVVEKKLLPTPTLERVKEKFGVEEAS
ncbi:MAG: helix-hairpin-helix domain-containing protein [Acidobacteriales bacterium]|nr:helix-hairpin-helix domain-containing protein [Terriglobales bacterium]